jgi:short subunit dehydrogenase-like uncharacterized protein
VDTPKVNLTLHFNTDMQAWAIPMPVVDPHIVKRSIYNLPLDYGYATAYRQFFVRSTFWKTIKTILPVGMAFVLVRFPAFRNFMKKKFPPGTGPSDLTRGKSVFEFTCIGTSGQTKVITKMKGGDPGYNETAKMFSEAAFAMSDKLKDGTLRPGVLTPVHALGDNLSERLQKEGIVIEQKISRQP